LYYFGTGKAKTANAKFSVWRIDRETDFACLIEG
jgi:hypothetical protein